MSFLVGESDAGGGPLSPPVDTCVAEERQFSESVDHRCKTL
jgi:hypothetical protein